MVRSLSRLSALVLASAATLSAAFAAPVATTTTTALTVTSGGNPVTSVAAKTVVTLTATVLAGSTAASPGVVNFCDVALKASCTFQRILGSAQVTAAGTAVFRYIPAPGNHVYQAVFVGTKAYAASTSATSPLTGPESSTTTLAASGTPGNYTLTGTVTANIASATTGNVALIDNYLSPPYTLATQSLPLTTVPTTFNVAGTPGAQFLALQSFSADFNGDGIPDLATATNNEYLQGYLQVALGNGDGTFSGKYSYQNVKAQFVGVTALDFNSDGIPDLALLDYAGNLVYLLKGAGDGTFSYVGVTSVGANNDEVSLTSGDLNRDGIPDLVVVSQGYVTVLFGKGDGTFPSSTVVKDTGSPIFSQAVIADVNNDGIPDLVVSEEGLSSFIALGDGTGNFPTHIQGPGAPNGYGTVVFTPMVVGDFNNDGLADTATLGISNDGFGLIDVCLQKSGTTSPSFNCTSYADPFDSSNSPWPTSLAQADFTNDGSTDLALFEEGDTDTAPTQPQAGAGHLTLFTNDGAGSFTASTSTPTDDILSYANGFLGGIIPAVGDFNGDGTPDLVEPTYNYYRIGSSLDILLGSPVTFTGNFTFTNISVQSDSLAVHPVVASYSTDIPALASTSPAVSLTSNAVLTSLFLTADPLTGATTGQQIDLIASLTPANAEGTETANGSSISFYDTDATPQLVGTSNLVDGFAELNVTSLPAGANHLYASFSATGPFLASTSPTLLLTLGSGGLPPQTVNWDPSALTIYTGTPLGSGVLDATDSVPATFAYTSTLQPSGTPQPATASTVLAKGGYILTATITPQNYATYAVTNLDIPFYVQDMNVFAAGNESVGSFYHIGTIQSAFNQYGGTGTAVDSNGNVWSIAGGTVLAEYDPSGNLIGSYGLFGLSGASALAIDGNSNIWVANGNRTLREISNTGNLIFPGGQTASVPGAISIDPSGNLWLTNPAANSVQEFLGAAAPTLPLTNATVRLTPAVKP